MTTPNPPPKPQPAKRPAQGEAFGVAVLHHVAVNDGSASGEAARPIPSYDPSYRDTIRHIVVCIRNIKKIRLEEQQEWWWSGN
jgi:hypothetical protein